MDHDSWLSIRKHQFQTCSRPHPNPIWTQLQAKLLSITEPGSWVCLDPETALGEWWWANKINQHGQHWPNVNLSARRMKRQAGNCYQNSRDLNAKNPGWQCVKGWAFNQERNEWIHHGWCLNTRGQVVESTRFGFTHYYGVVVVGGMLKPWQSGEWPISQGINKIIANYLWYIEECPPEKYEDHRYVMHHLDLWRRLERPAAAGGTLPKYHAHHLICIEELIKFKSSKDPSDLKRWLSCREGELHDIIIIEPGSPVDRAFVASSD